MSGDMETRRHGDTETGKHGDTETGRHGDTEIGNLPRSRSVVHLSSPALSPVEGFIVHRSSFIVGRYGGVALALTAALLAVVCMIVGFNRAWPLTLDVGTRDARFVAGFHEVERFNAQPARWTTGAATIALPRPPTGADTLLELRMLSGRPASVPDAHVTLRAAGHTLGDFDVIRKINGARIYRVLVPADERFDWATRIDLSSTTFSLPNDPRPLGAVVDRATLRPSGRAPLLPSPWLIFWSAGLGLLGYALPRSVGIGRGPAWLLAAVLAALVAWGVAARPLEVLPFVHRITALLGLGCLGIWLARLLAPPTMSPLHPITPSARHTGRRWSIRGADLPIYLAVAGWMGPLFEVVLTADGAVNVSPPIPAAWIGGITGLLLLGIVGWRALHRTNDQRPTTNDDTDTIDRVPATNDGEPGISHERPTTDDGEPGTSHERRRQNSKLKTQNSKLLRWSLVVLALAALAHLAYMLWFAFHRQGPDFWILFKGARDWARGGSLYDLNAVITDHFGHVFKVPPFYGMLFVPFVFQDGDRILFFHRVLNTLLIGATALVWLRMWRLRLLSAAGVGVLVLLNFRPLADTLAFGQIDLALLLILTLALWALREERDLAAGALVALGTLFKIYPVLLLAFFVVKRRWYALAGFVLGMLVLNGLAVAVMGWEMHRVYLTEVLPRIGGSTSWVENQTISGFLARLVDLPTEAAVLENRAIALLGMALSAAVALLACLLSLRPARPKSSRYALQYGQFLLLMVLAIPAAWMHYETLLFIPFAALLLHLRDREVGLVRAAVLALSFALIAYGNQWSFYDGTVMGVLTIAGVSYKFYGMLLLGGVLARTLLEGWGRSSVEPSAQTSQAPATNEAAVVG